jgi:hypothetical protein
MNTSEIRKQLKRIASAIFAGSAFSIYLVQHYNNWWMGLFGIPLGVLLCDVGKTIQVLRKIYDSFGQLTFPKMHKLAYTCLRTLDIVGSILLAYLISSLVLLYLNVTYTIDLAFSHSMLLSGLGIISLWAIISVFNDANKMERKILFPISNQLVRFKSFLFINKKSKSEDIPLQPKEDRKLFSRKGMEKKIRETFEIVYVIAVTTLCSFLIIVVIVDIFLAILLTISPNKSTAVMIGIVLAFTFEYHYPLSHPLLSLLFYSTIGSIVGSLLWWTRELIQNATLHVLDNPASA